MRGWWPGWATGGRASGSGDSHTLRYTLSDRPEAVTLSNIHSQIRQETVTLSDRQETVTLSDMHTEARDI